MQLRALAIILTGSCILGLLLYLPFHLWFRWRRKAGRPAAPGRYGAPVPRGELKWMVVLVVLLMVGFAQGRVAPTTWFGARMQTPGGRAVLGLVLVVAIAAIRVAWVAYRAHAAGTRLRRQPGDRDA
ncbi:MAG TPA: hypothetical protein VMU00_11690 [Steroidobacteraceae bacterium]|nr:hypothetical protein [Steroidobacteraceae bacterium]